jgi:sulfotransferase family protein
VSDRWPDFYIVGAPKSATTFLVHHLSQHPRILLPPVEFHYFGSDLEFRRQRTTRAEYLAYFDQPGPGRVVGEKSAHYLQSAKAAGEIAAVRPDAHIIITLRNPLDLIWSFHGHHLRDGEDDIADVEDALAAEPARARGERIPPGNTLPQALQYTEVARFAPQVRRYMEAFPADQILVHLYDDVERDPQSVLSRTFAFLGVDPMTQMSISVVNAAGTLRSPQLQELLHEPPPLVSVIARRVMPRRARHWLARTLTELNKGPDERGGMPLDVRRRVGPRFDDDVRELETLIGRDLGAWLSSWR